MSVINTNISALAAQSSLRKTAISSSSSMERLSTGTRINSAKDDAAGLAISTRMTANIRGMAAAIRNSNDGISLTQTAEGNLAAIQNNLQRIRELAVQSANSGNSPSDRISMNLEAQQMITEIDRVAASAAFNGSKLLDGSFKAQDFQVGAGNDSSDRITISISSAKAATLGTVGATTTSTASATALVNSTGALLAGDVAIKGYAIGASVSDGISYADANASAIAKSNAINASSALTGITAKAEANSKTSGTITGTATVNSGTLSVNGIDIGGLTAVTTVTERTDQLVAAINAVSAQTGVTAVNTSNTVVMAATDGRNITTKLSVTTGGIAGFDTVTTDSTALAKYKLYSNSGDLTVAATGTATSLLKLGLSGSNSLATTSISGQTVTSVDISSQGGAQRALNILDSAIDTITNSRANLGAYQNRFEAAISNLETTSTNLQASRSRILDTDYAKETTNLAKAQIVQQAATAMLAQANQSSQSVLALLK
jgi:flagellin